MTDTTLPGDLSAGKKLPANGREYQPESPHPRYASHRAEQADAVKPAPLMTPAQVFAIPAAEFKARVLAALKAHAQKSSPPHSMSTESLCATLGVPYAKPPAGEPNSRKRVQNALSDLKKLGAVDNPKAGRWRWLRDLAPAGKKPARPLKFGRAQREPPPAVEESAAPLIAGFGDWVPALWDAYVLCREHGLDQRAFSAALEIGMAALASAREDMR